MKVLSQIGKAVAGFFTNNEKGSVLWLLEQLVVGTVTFFRYAGQFLAEFVAKQRQNERDEQK